MYKTLYLKENPDFEYQKRGKNWFKRKKGSNADFYAVNENGQIVLNKLYAKNLFFFYSTNFKVGVILSLGILAYYLKTNGLLNKIF
jgi:hypothetical protein